LPDFLERRTCELPRIILPRTPLNKVLGIPKHKSRRPFSALHFLPLLFGRMHFVPEDRWRRGVWRSVAQGTPGAVELRLLYLEFELERRLLAHERALKTFLLRSRGIS
jgi:hypothetical protein